MIIYLDFDGTVVEHNYPQIGRCNFGWVEVINKLQKAGHKIILNTMRAEFNDDSLEKALDYVNNKYWMVQRNKKEDINLQEISATSEKFHPHSWDLKKAIEKEVIYIDDIASGIPLKSAVMVNNNMVDWDELDKQFKEYKIY